jgi:hypothetical protein
LWTPVVADGEDLWGPTLRPDGDIPAETVGQRGVPSREQLPRSFSSSGILIHVDIKRLESEAVW